MGEGSSARALVLLLAVFFAALLPTLPELSRYHGDERFYTDAAITMAQSGDYLTPRYADGTERFRKPLLTYWVLCASYKVLGIGVFASRLPFLIAGCGVLWLTWRLGRTLFETEESATLAAFVIAANVQTMTIATRSTPDILLCLFVTASVLGFAQLLVRDTGGWRAGALAYLGAGLACATKGLWGLLPLVFAAGFWRWRARQVPLRRLAPPGWVLAGAAIGLSWFIVAALKYGRTSIQVFLEDQTIGQSEATEWFLVSNVLDYASATLRHFLPWSVFAFAGAAHLKTLARGNRNVFWFAFGWYALVFAVFSFGLVRRTRYLLPTYPCLAVILGAFLASVQHLPRARRINQAVLLAGIVVGAATAILGSRLDLRLTLGGVLMAGLALGLLRRTGLAAVAVFVIAAFSIVMLGWRPLLEQNPAHELVRKLSAPAYAGRLVAGLGTPPALNSQIRLVSGGKLHPREIGAASWPGRVPTNAVLIIAETWRERAAAEGYHLEPGGYRTRRIRPGDIWRAWRNGRREDMFERSRQNYYLAVRP